MHPMLRWITAGLTAFCLALAACVTINVTSPRPPPRRRPTASSGTSGGPRRTEAHRQRAGVARRRESGNLLFAALRGTLDFVIPAAHAEAGLDVSARRSGR